MRGASSAATATRSTIVGVDGNGRASIEWGVYGVPETFVIGRDGNIAYKLVGPVTPDNLDTVLKPELEKALKAGILIATRLGEIISRFYLRFILRAMAPP